MGMFDSFMLKVKCPYCGDEDVREFQTKDFDCVLSRWSEGDVFNPVTITINDGIVRSVYGSCNEKECRKYHKEKYPNSFSGGRLFNCDVVIENNRVKSAINVREGR